LSHRRPKSQGAQLILALNPRDADQKANGQAAAYYGSQSRPPGQQNQTLAERSEPQRLAA
jgi:hypothetical protein